MTVPSANRRYKVGETVHLRVRVNLPGTRIPTDAGSVVLTSLTRDGIPVPADTVFTRDALGDYSLVISTEGFSAGSYEVVVTISDGPEKVVVLEDTFVLRPV